MNLALCYLWKEWRAQRALLIAYHALIYACLCLGLYLAPRHVWFDESFGVHALSWFFAAGVIGVVAFVTPGLVRGEYTAQKGDQFVRRLPGALRPAFQGKLLFCVLAVVLMPLLGLLFGELFVTALGYDWDGLYRWGWGETAVWLELPWQVWWCFGALGLLPWIWAAGTWTPGGRLAPLAAALLALGIGVAVFAVLRQSPGLEKGIEVTSWLWTVPVAGFVVAGVSWVRGRRGGGPLRSAKVGLLATAVLLVPGSAWLGQRAYHYHHPRLDRLQRVQVQGLSRDGQYAIAAVSENKEWYGVNFRVDLETGAVDRLGGPFGAFGPNVLRPYRLELFAQRDLWQHYQIGDVRHVYDLAHNEWTQVGWNQDAQAMVLPEGLRQRAWQERRETTRFRAPGGVRVWVTGEEICFEAPDGSVERKPWPLATRAFNEVASTLRPSGHLLRGYPKGHYDLVRREAVEPCDWIVGDVRLHQPNTLHIHQRGVTQQPWRRQVAGGEMEDCGWPGGTKIYGLLDDERVLAGDGRRLFVLRPESDEVEQIALPHGWVLDHVYALAPLMRQGSLLERDFEGRVWLQAHVGGVRSFLRVDADRAEVAEVLRYDSDDQLVLVSWDERGFVTANSRSAEIVRHGYDGRRIERLFPRSGEER